jgi:hypothetical protein
MEIALSPPYDFLMFSVNKKIPAKRDILIVI